MPFNQQFKAGDKIISIAYHPPEIRSGTKATIVSLQRGKLYAVQLPDGEYHTWFAGSELQAVNPRNRVLKIGDSAKILEERGHPPKINKGMIVKIVKVITQTPFYDVRLENGSYHRWLAEFEIIHPI